MRSRSDSPTAPREARRARLDPPAIREEGDDTGWLTTFSDLVLQLFGFVILVAAIGGAQADRAVARPAPRKTSRWTAATSTPCPAAICVLSSTGCPSVLVCLSAATHFAGST